MESLVLTQMQQQPPQFHLHVVVQHTSNSRSGLHYVYPWCVSLYLQSSTKPADNDSEHASFMLAGVSDRMAAYVAVLIREMEATSRLGDGSPLQTVFFGGGVSGYGKEQRAWCVGVWR